MHHSFVPSTDLFLFNEYLFLQIRWKRHHFQLIAHEPRHEPMEVTGRIARCGRPKKRCFTLNYFRIYGFCSSLTEPMIF